MRVKVISSWSRAGGSTLHHISLTNLLNENGIDCTFFGPHDWHLSQCKGELLDKATITEEDTIISHFIQIPPPMRWKKHILSCHETNLFPLKRVERRQYDVIQFVSNSQKAWHGVNHPSVIIPPLVEKVKWKDPRNNTAGVIGSIDAHKQTHLSIERALKDGYTKVLLFGEVTDLPYFNKHVAKHVQNGVVVSMGHEDEREAMYGQLSTVYHTSLRETYGLVEAECRLAGVPFNGPSNNQEILDKEEILERWVRLLDEDNSCS